MKETSTENVKVFSRRLKTARERAGLTQTELARQIGIAPGTIGNWEVGRNDASGDHLKKLSRILLVSQGWLMGEGADEIPPHDPTREVVSVKMKYAIKETAEELKTYLDFDSLGHYFEHLVRKDWDIHKAEILAIHEQTAKKTRSEFEIKPASSVSPSLETAPSGPVQESEPKHKAAGTTGLAGKLAGGAADKLKFQQSAQAPAPKLPAKKQSSQKASK